MNWKIKHIVFVSLPVCIIGACIFWIVRLELNAAALTSRVEELHNALIQNKDGLAKLDWFYREVNNSGITLDKNGAILYKDDSKIFFDNNEIKITDGKNRSIAIDKKNNWVYLVNDEVQVTLGNTTRGGISSKGLHISTTLNNTKNYAKLIMNDRELLLYASDDKRVKVGVTGNNETSVLFNKEGVRLQLNPKKEDFYVNLSYDKNRIELKKDNSKIVLGDGDMTTVSGVTSAVKGAFIENANVGSIGIAKDKGIAIRNVDDNGIKIAAAKDFNIEMRPKEDLMKLKKDKCEIQMGKTKYGDGLILQRMFSQVQIGETKFGEGISFGETSTSTLSIIKGKGIAIRTEGVGNEMKITGEDKLVITFEGDIDINAYGNLNLNSLNGNVNLVGKRINFNE